MPDFDSIHRPARGEAVAAGTVADIIAAGTALAEKMDELERDIVTARGRRGRRGRSGANARITAPRPPRLHPSGLELLTAEQVAAYADVLTALGCTIPTLENIADDVAFALYATDLPTLIGGGLTSVTINPTAATWALAGLTPGTTYTLTRSSTAGKYTPTATMGGEPKAVLMGSDTGTTTTTQQLVSGSPSGSGDVAQLTDCPIAQVRWAEIDGDSGLYYPFVLPLCVPLF